jgi:protein phosphatase
MKTIEVGDGNTFLLCTDGITRHIPDTELEELLLSGQSAEAICAAMKERCYQRGAEDNLTAVIVQIGTPPANVIDEERTVSTDRSQFKTTTPSVIPPAAEVRLTPPSRVAFPGPATVQTASDAPRIDAKRRSGAGRTVLRFFVFLLFVGIAAGAFYAGSRYQQGKLFPSLLPAPSAAPQPSPTPTPDSSAAFEQKRAAVDADPKKWLAEVTLPKATDSKDPEFLYLYGRALMLTGNHRDAMQAFELAVNNLRTESNGHLPFGAEVKLGQAAAALKLRSQSPAGRSQEELIAEQKAASALDEVLGLKSEAPPR